MNAFDIYDNKDVIIPVIGENCFFYYSDDGSKIPLQDYLVDKFIERNRIRHPEDLPIEQMKKKGFYGLSLCRQQCGFSRDEEYIKCYKNIIREAKERIHLDKTIKDFLVRYKFHLIITTCCFDFIESELPWYISKSYIAAKGGNNKEDINPNDYIIYHIFGKCDNASVWAWDEESLMYILHCHHDNDYASNGLHRYIFPDLNSGGNSKSLLILYSNLPDWLFRFFLYPLAYKGKWSDSGFYLNKNEQDSSLKNFIERVICYDIEDNNIDQILNEAKDMIPSLEQDSSKRIGHNQDFDIFISYAHEDKEIALEIKETLEKHYALKIWLDLKEIEDGSYSERMKFGIQHSAYFMPLITNSYIDKLKNRVYDSSLYIDEILKDDKRAAYVQKEAWAASCHWQEVIKKYPQREAYVLPILFADTKVTYNTIQTCIGELGQLPENIFKEQTIFTYSNTLLIDKDWSRYKTIEK